jgi:hypothetical protein
MTRYIVRYGIVGLVVIIWNCATGHPFSWLFVIFYAAILSLLACVNWRIHCEARRIGTLVGRRWQQAKKQL